MKSEEIKQFLNDIYDSAKEEDYKHSIKQLKELTEMLRKAELKNKDINLYDHLHKLGYGVDDVIKIVTLNNSHLIPKEKITDLLERFNNEEN
jgi:hypothetical protein